MAYWRRKGRRSGAAPARCERRRRAVGAAWEEAGQRGRQRGARGIYRRGEGVRVPRISIIREGLARRLRERGGKLIRAGQAGGWGRADERGPPGSGSERRRARARAGRSTSVGGFRALGAGLGPNGQLGRLGRSWAEPSFGPGCGECVRVFFF